MRHLLHGFPALFRFICSRLLDCMAGIAASLVRLLLIAGCVLAGVVQSMAWLVSGIGAVIRFLFQLVWFLPEESGRPAEVTSSRSLRAGKMQRTKPERLEVA